MPNLGVTTLNRAFQCFLPCFLLGALLTLSSGCVLLEDMDHPSPPNGRHYGDSELGDTEFAQYDGDSYSGTDGYDQAPYNEAPYNEAPYREPSLHELDDRRVDPVQRKRLEDSWGAGETVALLTGTYASKQRNFAVNVPLASWYVREQDRKGVGLIGGALAYDMVTTQRVEGRPITQKKTSFGLLGIAGNIDERSLDGSGGYRKFSWLFPFYRYQNINGERVLYPFFIFPVPLERDTRPHMDQAPWQATADAPIDPLPVEESLTPVTTTQAYGNSGQRTMTLKRAPAPPESKRAGSMDRISNWLDDRPVQEQARKSTRARKEDPNRATGGWRSSAKKTARPARASAKAPQKNAGTPSRYTVRKGDTLYAISRRIYGNSRDWKRIFNANRSVLSTPDRLKEGMVLRLPQ